MSSTSGRRRGAVFDEVAAAYDRSRPAYPRELINRACEIAGLGIGDPVLEVGCGSGQLTRDLVTRGLHVTAVEPGRNLLSLAEQNLEGLGRVESVNARFEDARLPSDHFQAVFSASAFHWLDPEVSWQKAAHVLAPRGTLALLQYCGLEEERSRCDQEDMLAILARNVPKVAAEWPSYRDLDTIASGVEQRRENISEVWAWVGSHDVARSHAGDLFCDVRISCVPQLLEQTADEVTALLRTASFYARLSPGQRRALESDTAELHERLGRPIRSSVVAVLVTARRRAASRAG